MTTRSLHAPPSTAFSSATSSIKCRTPSPIPEDIVLCIIDGLKLPQLIRMAHVCRDWRRLAYSHPIFWRDVEVSSTEPASLACFHARLSAHKAPITWIYVCLTKEDPAIDLVVLPALATHLHRCKALEVTIHPSKAEGLFNALRGGAPLLSDLCINFSQPELTVDRHVLLPPNLLGGTAPRLTSVSGENLLLPVDAVTAFAGVSDVYRCASYDATCAGNTLRISPRLISKHFPCVRDLRFQGGGFVMHTGEGLFSDRLESLCLEIGPMAYIPILYVPQAARRVPKIIIFQPTNVILSLVLSHFNHSASMRCHIAVGHTPRTADSPHFSLMVELMDLGEDIIRRTFQEVPAVKTHGDGLPVDAAPPIFDDSSWFSRIIDLRLEADIWGHAGTMKWIPGFPALRYFTLDLNRKGTRVPPAAKIICPVLETIDIISPKPCSIRRTEIAQLLRDGLVAPLDRITISAGFHVEFIDPAADQRLDRRH